jgi:hypothetical protein
MMQSMLQLLLKQMMQMLLLLLLLLRRPAHLLLQHTSGISNTSSIMGHNSSRRKHVSLRQPRLVKVNISFKVSSSSMCSCIRQCTVVGAAMSHADTVPALAANLCSG